MKILLTLVVFCLCASPVLAEESGHHISSAPTFAGVPWGVDRQAVIADLQRKGYAFVKKDGDGDLWFKGNVDGQRSEIIEMFASGKLAKAQVHLMTSDDECKSTYDELVRTLSTKYGEPSNTFAFYDSPYEAGDGFFDTAVHVGKAHFASYWTTAEDGQGAVYIEIRKSMTVDVSYESAAWSTESHRRQGKETRDF